MTESDESGDEQQRGTPKKKGRSLLSGAVTALTAPSTAPPSTTATTAPVGAPSGSAALSSPTSSSAPKTGATGSAGVAAAVPPKGSSSTGTSTGKWESSDDEGE